MSGSRPPSPLRDQVRRTPSWLAAAALLLLLTLAGALAWRAGTAPANGDDSSPAEDAPEAD